ncbi:MAG: hypothetical protein II276_03315 [Bacteroidales bacterium]|nr:hypothetical protein [Bacteroidales bacterium]
MMLLLLGANLYSCGKENFGEADIIGKGDASYSENDNTTPGEDGEIEEEKKEFIDTTDWSDYDDSTYLIGFGGVCEEVETVRATITMGDNETPAQTRWESGDEVLVYVPSKSQTGIYAYDATRKQFRPLNVNNVVANKNEVAYAYYPASLYSNPANGKVSFNLQNGIRTTNDLGEKLPMSAKILSTSNDPHPTATFKNLCSILRVQLTGCETATSVTLSNDNIPLAGGGTVAWNGDAPTLTTSGGSKSITINLGNGILLNENNANEYYFILPSSGTSMSGMKVSTKFTQNDGSYTYTPTLTRSRSGSLAYGRSQVIKVALRAGFFSGGNGTEANPYQIKTANDLLQLSKLASSLDASEGYNESNTLNYFRSTVHYKQTADIDCSSLGNNMGIIGSNNALFYGKYDGQNKVISNLTITGRDEIQVALFAHLNGASITNTILQNASISSVNKNVDCNTAALVGRISNGTIISNCQVISSNISGMKCGGIIGYSYDGSVSYCQSRGNTITSSGTYLLDDVESTGFCGGVVGGSHNISMKNCSCYGANEDGKGTPTTLSGQGATGGIIGYVGGDAGSGIVDSCYVSNTSIISTGSNVGGQIGRVFNGSIMGRKCSDGLKNAVDNRKGAITIQGKTNVGGLVGTNSGSITGTKYGGTNASYTALVVKATIVATDSKAGGLCGVNDGILKTCYVNQSKITTQGGDQCGAIVGQLRYESQEKPGHMIDCLYRADTLLAGNGNGTYYNNVGGYCGVMENKTLIDNSASTSFSGYGSKIEGNANVGGVVGTMKGGTITGRENNHLISGGKQDNGKEMPFSIIAHGNNSSMGVGRYAATETGATGLIEKLIVGHTTEERNTLTGKLYIGGIVGYVESELNIQNCKQNGTKFIGSEQIGGIVGRFDGNGQISNCRNNLMWLGGAYNHVGGIVGVFEEGEIYRCNNFSDINGNLYVGGIAGTFWGGDIYQCYSGDGKTISGKHDIGGLVGKLGSTDTANHKNCLLLCSTSRSYVVGTGVFDTKNYRGSIGGLVGEMDNDGEQHTTIANCVAWARNVRHMMATAKNIGGIVGYVTAKDEVGEAKKSKNLIQACYTQHGDDYLLVGGTSVTNAANATRATTADNNAGGIYGYLRYGTVKDCYYICVQNGLKNTNSTATNYTKISTDAKNGIVNITVTLTTENTARTGRLYAILNAMDDKVSYPITRGSAKSLVKWTTYDPSTANNFLFAVPSVLLNSDLGPDFYLN